MKTHINLSYNFPHYEVEMFRKIQNRETKGIKLDVDTCFVPVFLQFSPLDESEIQSFFKTQYNEDDQKPFISLSCLSYAKAFEREEDAEKSALASIQNNINLEDLTTLRLINPDYLDEYRNNINLELKASDLCKNAFWILKVKGKADEVTPLLLPISESDTQMDISNLADFGARLIFAISNSKTTLVEYDTEKLTESVQNKRACI